MKTKIFSLIERAAAVGVVIGVVGLVFVVIALCCHLDIAWASNVVNATSAIGLAGVMTSFILFLIKSDSFPGWVFFVKLPKGIIYAGLSLIWLGVSCLSSDSMLPQDLIFDGLAVLFFGCCLYIFLAAIRKVLNLGAMESKRYEN